MAVFQQHVYCSILLPRFVHLDTMERHLHSSAQAHLCQAFGYQRYGDQVQAQGPGLSDLERYHHLYVQRAFGKSTKLLHSPDFLEVKLLPL